MTVFARFPGWSTLSWRSVFPACHDGRIAQSKRAIPRLPSAHLRHSGLRYLLTSESGTTGSLTKDLAIKLARAYERDRWRISPRRLGAKVERIPIDRPIFLVGTQGAGETIIGRCLRRHRTVVSFSGNSDFWTGADEMGTVRNRMQRLPKSLWGSKHRSDIPHAYFGTDQPYACDVLLPHYRRVAADATDGAARRFKRLLREHLAVYAHDPLRARFIDKTHAYTVKMPLIESLLGDARPFFLLVVRNPFETCRWALERKPQLFRSDLPRSKRVALIAGHWSNSYGIALSDASAVANVAILRFEDFLADPPQVIRAVCDFVGLDFDATMVPQLGQELPFATLPRDRKWYPLYESDWLTGMPAEEEEIITTRCGVLAERFGYSAHGTSPSTSGPLEVLGAGTRERAAAATIRR